MMPISKFVRNFCFAYIKLALIYWMAGKKGKTVLERVKNYINPALP
jgi:hypothetical protein